MDRNEGDIIYIKQMARNMRRHVLDMALEAGGDASHFGGGLSIVDILAVLYGKIMRIDKYNSKWEDRDRFILSKGHGVLGYYAALREIGYLTAEDILTFEKANSFLAGHPVRNIDKGIECTNGSLGMGLSVGVGLALAAKKKNKSYKTYVLMGDGECNEGSIWEAMMSAVQFELDNLIAVVDRNQLQLGGKNFEVMNLGNMVKKAESFGFNSIEVDGHEIDALIAAFSTHCENNRPLIIIANTIKGKGFSFSHDNNAWHHAVLTKAQYMSAIQELEVEA